MVDGDDERSVSQDWNQHNLLVSFKRILLTTALAWCLPNKQIVVKIVYIGCNLGFAIFLKLVRENLLLFALKRCTVASS